MARQQVHQPERAVQCVEDLHQRHAQRPLVRLRHVHRQDQLRALLREKEVSKVLVGVGGHDVVLLEGELEADLAEVLSGVAHVRLGLVLAVGEGVEVAVPALGLEVEPLHRRLAQEVVRANPVPVPQLQLQRLPLRRVHVDDEFFVEEGIQVLPDDLGLLLRLAHAERHEGVTEAVRVLGRQVARPQHLDGELLPVMLHLDLDVAGDAEVTRRLKREVLLLLLEHLQARQGHCHLSNGVIGVELVLVEHADYDGGGGRLGDGKVVLLSPERLERAPDRLCAHDLVLHLHKAVGV
mmetsp:Transcript_22265/g.87722  ORF Transcript_22265/g.87722 Transcript_22265/m.87722 type:complete len:294 (+) Transcript_22265:2027-2908(+)